MSAAKTALRQRALAVRAEAARTNPAAGEALARFAEHLRARCVAFYRPIRSEIDPYPLARIIAGHGASLALPAIVGRQMEFRAYREGDTLSPGALGIEEPQGPPAAPDLLLVPLLAFTRAGGRLGYGAGHYDSYLGQHPGVRAVGVAFHAQEVARLPLEPHDQTLSAIVTERGFIAIKEPACG